MSHLDRDSRTRPSDRDDELLFAPTRAFSPQDSAPAIDDHVGILARWNVETLARSSVPDDHAPIPDPRAAALTALPLETYTPGTAAGQVLSASAIPTPMLTTLSGTAAHDVPWRLPT